MFLPDGRRVIDRNVERIARTEGPVLFDTW